ncbi:MAG: hypothetical protein IJ141_03220 [Lachnospiraceae bacterium]|nr:hypothetical protein [Lachnospiraceae bacterium]
MGLLNEIKNNQNNEDKKKALIENERKTQIVPEDIAYDIADFVFNIMLENIKLATSYRQEIIHDKGIFGQVKNSYYKIGLERRADTLLINTERNDLWNDGLFPKNNGYIGSLRSDSGKTEIICKNIEVVRAVFSKLVRKFEHEKIKCVFEINEESSYRPEMEFYVVIPCDKEGNVLD